jgi:hypothetical protein
MLCTHVQKPIRTPVRSTLRPSAFVTTSSGAGQKPSPQTGKSSSRERYLEILKYRRKLGSRPHSTLPIETFRTNILVSYDNNTRRFRIMLSIVVGSALLILLMIVSIRRNRISGLRGIPNAHFSVPYSRLWLLTTRWRKVENRTRIQIHRLYGPVVRIAPTEVSVNCIDDGVRIIYSSKFDKDPSFYHALIDKYVH